MVKPAGIIIITILMLFAGKGFACLWPVGERYTVGKPIDLENVSETEYIRRLTTTDSREYWDDLLKQLYDQKKKEAMIDVETNIAVALVHLGQYQEALRIFKGEERSYKAYNTAANIGTTYELLGQNDKALHWIKEGLTRDPGSHYRTEWLHVKILEAKIALERDPKWLEKNTVLGIDWESVNRNPSAELTVTDHRGQVKSAKEIEDALAYQLHERMEFVKPPDQVVAQLLFDLSNVLRRSRSSEHATAVHKLAIDYGHKSILPAVAAPVKTDLEAPTVVPARFSGFTVVGASVLAVVLLATGYYFCRRR